MPAFGGLFLLAALLAGCASEPLPVTVDPGEDQKIVQMTATNFNFNPKEIYAYQGDTLILRILNDSFVQHNITIFDPRGAVLINQDLPEHQTTPVVVHLSFPGDYPFYCDKALHSTLGMRGFLHAAAR